MEHIGATWEHALRLFLAGLPEQSRQVIHRLRQREGVSFSNTLYQNVCARCSSILFPNITCSTELKRWKFFRRELLKRRRSKGLFEARFRQAIFLSTLDGSLGGTKRLTDDDYVTVYNCKNCKYDLIFDIYAIKKANLVMDRESAGKAGGKRQKRENKEEKEHGRKAAVKKILVKPAPTTKTTASLDLSDFLKKLSD